MRLLHVVPTYFPAMRYGGPIIAVHGLCRALAARGHEVEVFTTSVDGTSNLTVPHGVPVELDGVTVRYFPSPWFRRLFYAPTLTSAFGSDVMSADAVHLHSIFLWPTWRAARTARKVQIPYIISPRGMLVKRLIAARHRLIKSAWITLIEKYNMESAAAVHVTSLLEAQEIDQFGWRLRRTVIVPNGIEEIDEQEKNGRPSDDIAALAREQPLVLFFGRLARVKGLDRLLHGFARTKHGTLAIVGTDYDGLAPGLLRLVKELGLNERVRFIPRTVTGVDKEIIFEAARVFVLPSYSESFGNSVLEAMQRGVPVLVTPEVGAAEVVRKSGGGLVINGDPPCLGEAMDLLIQDPARCLAIGTMGRRHVSTYYSWPSVAARMEDVYRSLRPSQ